MKFFIDTANLDQIREAEQLGVLESVVFLVLVDYLLVLSLMTHTLVYKLL
jgi:hypothetical protein